MVCCSALIYHMIFQHVPTYVIKLSCMVIMVCVWVAIPCVPWQSIAAGYSSTVVKIVLASVSSSTVRTFRCNSCNQMARLLFLFLLVLCRVEYMCCGVRGCMTKWAKRVLWLLDSVLYWFSAESRQLCFRRVHRWRRLLEYTVWFSCVQMWWPVGCVYAFFIVVFGGGG